MNQLAFSDIAILFRLQSYAESNYHCANLNFGYFSVIFVVNIIIFEKMVVKRKTNYFHKNVVFLITEHIFACTRIN